MLRAAIIIFALFSGGLAAWVAALPNASPETTVYEPVAPVPAIDVLVAATDVPSGTALVAENLRWQAWPTGAVSPAFITRDARPDAETEMTGMVVRSGFTAGEPVHDSRLLGSGAGYLSVMLASGMRALAVRISAENTAGGFILPNDHVDVVHTFTVSDANGAAQTNSRVILRNVRVLAIDQLIAERDNDSVIGKTATLELGVEQLEVVTAAEASGTISLALRPLADNAVTDVVQGPTTRTIKIFRGSGVELVKVGEPDANKAARP